MKVDLDRTFPMPAGADAAWAFLQDVQAVAQCMPGAAITERVDDRHFKGTVSVRFGPASMSFRGEVEVKELDASARTLRLVGTGTDSTGTSGASMNLTARIEAAGDAGSNLVGSSEVSINGKAAAFGGRMLSAVADQVLKQFAANLAARIVAAAAPPAGDVPPAPSPAPPPAAMETRARELNGLALLWAVFRNWLRALFGRGTA